MSENRAYKAAEFLLVAHKSMGVLIGVGSKDTLVQVGTFEQFSLWQRMKISLLILTGALKWMRASRTNR